MTSQYSLLKRLSLFRLSLVPKSGSTGTFVPSLTAGGSNAVLLISLQLSLTAMLFSQELSVFIPKGMGILLCGTVIIGLMGTLKSSHPSCIALVQNAPVAILGLPLLTISQAMTARATSQEAIFYTIVATLGISTLVTGGLMVGMARFRLGNFVRFIPYPVIGGFLAGIGWLLFKGGIGVMTHLSMHLDALPGLFAPMVLVKWIPGIFFALVLYYLIKNYNHFMVLPGMVIGGTALFFIILKILGISFFQAEQAGWFLGPFPQGVLWHPIPLSGLSQVCWDLVFDQSLTMILIFLISTIALLLNASGLELVSKRDIDTNNELKMTGIANIMAAFSGSPPGYLGIGASILSHRLAPGSRLAGVVTSALCLGVLIFGASVLSGFPRPLAGAMLVLVGLDMLWEWLHDNWFKLPLTDYLLVLTIMLIIASIGFMAGVAAGLVIAVILFVINYSRITIIKTIGSGKFLRSNVERPAPHRLILDREGEQIQILQLHGFIFFGTANQLKARIVRQADARADREGGSLKYIVLDFHKVNGLDSSALNSFERIHQFARTRGICLVFSNLSAGFKKQLVRTSLIRDGVKIFPDLDHGIEWCENRLLDREAAYGQHRHQLFDATVDDLLKALDQADIFEQLIVSLSAYTTPIDIHTGQLLFPKGRPVRGIYLIESGRISIRLDQNKGHPLRLRTLGPGNIIGQWGDCNPGSPDTCVQVTTRGRIYHLSDEALICLEKKDPALALNLYKHMTRELSERVARTSTLIQTLI